MIVLVGGGMEPIKTSVKQALVLLQTEMKQTNPVLLK
jgi:hypothetical protein